VRHASPLPWHFSMRRSCPNAYLSLHRPVLLNALWISSLLRLRRHSASCFVIYTSQLCSMSSSYLSFSHRTASSSKPSLDSYSARLMPPRINRRPMRQISLPTLLVQLPLLQRPWLRIPRSRVRHVLRRDPWRTLKGQTGRQRVVRRREHVGSAGGVAQRVRRHGIR